MTVQVVSFHCVLQNRLGQIISSSFNSEVSTTASDSDAGALPGFVEALKELKEGEKKRITVPAEKAYGFYYPELVISVARSRLKNGRHLKISDQVLGSLDGKSGVKAYRVIEANPQSVVLDGNHPLAGQDLVFDVEMLALRHEDQAQPSSPSQWYC